MIITGISLDQGKSDLEAIFSSMSETSEIPEVATNEPIIFVVIEAVYQASKKCHHFFTIWIAIAMSYIYHFTVSYYKTYIMSSLIKKNSFAKKEVKHNDRIVFCNKGAGDELKKK